MNNFVKPWGIAKEYRNGEAGFAVGDKAIHTDGWGNKEEITIKEVHRVNPNTGRRLYSATGKSDPAGDIYGYDESNMTRA